MQVFKALNVFTVLLLVLVFSETKTLSQVDDIDPFRIWSIWCPEPLQYGVEVISPVRVRVEPGLQADIIRTAQIGEQFPVHKEIYNDVGTKWSDGYEWVPVVVEGQDAWIAEEGFLKYVGIEGGSSPFETQVEIPDEPVALNLSYLQFDEDITNAELLKERLLSSVTFRSLIAQAEKAIYEQYQYLPELGVTPLPLDRFSVHAIAHNAVDDVNNIALITYVVYQASNKQMLFVETAGAAQTMPVIGNPTDFELHVTLVNSGGNLVANIGYTPEGVPITFLVSEANSETGERQLLEPGEFGVIQEPAVELVFSMAGQGSVVETGATLRSAPDETAQSVFELNPEAEIVLISQVDATWYEAQFGQISGYISADQIAFNDPLGTGIEANIADTLQLVAPIVSLQEVPVPTDLPILLPYGGMTLVDGDVTRSEDQPWYANLTQSEMQNIVSVAPRLRLRNTLIPVNRVDIGETLGFGTSSRSTTLISFYPVVIETPRLERGYLEVNANLIFEHEYLIIPAILQASTGEYIVVEFQADGVGSAEYSQGSIFTSSGRFGTSLNSELQELLIPNVQHQITLVTIADFETLCAQFDIYDYQAPRSSDAVNATLRRALFFQVQTRPIQELAQALRTGNINLYKNNVVRVGVASFIGINVP